MPHSRCLIFAYAVRICLKRRIYKLHNSTPEILKWTVPSLNLDTSTVTNRIRGLVAVSLQTTGL